MTSDFEPCSGPTAGDDHEYDDVVRRTRERFDAAFAAGRLFTTDAAGLFEAYLDGLPSLRRFHDCSACRRFIETYGGLVTIDAAGTASPVAWGDGEAPEFYRGAVASLARIVRRAGVTGVFLSSRPSWGTPETGRWKHFHATPSPSLVFHHPLLTARQAMAEKREDFGAVRRALSEFPLDAVERVAELLRSETLYRGEKVLGVAEWLRDLHRARDAARGPSRDNLVWRAIASAPAGYCHPRASMIGTLLDDVVAGLAFDDAARRFAAKMHPLRYLRPQAAPSAGNIAQAEKVVAALGAAGSLARRFMRPDEVEAIWRPRPRADRPVVSGVFSHLFSKANASSKPAGPPPIVMTWEKFARVVLPHAEAIEFYCRREPDSYTAFVTAVDPDAPPILQWDREDRRNPASWYVWLGGSPPEQWGLVPNRFHPVYAVSLKPSRWGAPEMHAHQGDAAIFLIDGAKETRMAGAAIFPEFLRSEFHAVRATIEAYSRSATIDGLGAPSACGIMLDKGSSWNARLRATTGESRQEYILDRWD